MECNKIKLMEMQRKIPVLLPFELFVWTILDTFSVFPLRCIRQHWDAQQENSQYYYVSQVLQFRPLDFWWHYDFNAFHFNFDSRKANEIKKINLSNAASKHFIIHGITFEMLAALTRVNRANIDSSEWWNMPMSRRIFAGLMSYSRKISKFLAKYLKLLYSMKGLSAKRFATTFGDVCK